MKKNKTQLRLLSGAIFLITLGVIGFQDLQNQDSEHTLFKVARAEVQCPPPQSISRISIFDDNNNVIASYSSENQPGNVFSATYNVTAGTRIKYTASTEGVELVNRTPGSRQYTNLPVTVSGTYYPTGYSLTKRAYVNGTTDSLTAGTTGTISVGGSNSCIPDPNNPGASDESGASNVTLKIVVSGGIDMFCSPATQTINIPTSNSSNSVVYNIELTGSGDPVTLSNSFEPSSGNLPSVSYSSNPANPQSVVMATVSVSQNVAPNTYVITFTAQSGTQVKSCQVSLVAKPTINVDLKCLTSDNKTSDGPCTVASGASPVLSWGPTNAESCTLTPPGTSANVAGQQYTAKSISSSTTYTLSCQSGNQQASDTVQVLVDGDSATKSGDIDCGAYDSKADINCEVESGRSTTLFWVTNNISSKSVCTVYFRSPSQIKPVKLADGLQGSSISSGNLYQNTTFYLDCDGTVLDSVLVTVKANLSVPANIETSSGCSEIIVKWQPGSGGTAAPLFRVYRRLQGASKDELIGTVDGGVYQYTDQQGLSENTTYEYTVTAYSPTTEQETVKSLFVTARLKNCVPDISNSDIDIVSVARGARSQSRNYIPCNNLSEPVKGVDESLFQENDVVTLQIHVCNEGEADLGNGTIVNSMVNLVPEGTESFSPVGCAAKTPQSNYPMTYTLQQPITPGVSCNITFQGKVKRPNNAVSGSLYRFQDLADITSGSLFKAVQTLPYLFQIGGGPPIREEIPPQ